MTENQNESVKALETGIEQARAAIRAVREEQLTLPTPCEKWDVGQLLAHLAYDPGYMLEMVTGGSPDWSAIPARIEDPASTFDAGAEKLLAHYRSTGQSADWQVAELAVHTWDLATATGQPVDGLDPEVADRGLAFMTQTLKPEMRVSAFGPEQPAPAGASAYERIAAFAGRRLG
jgi:uncharacterized protein (TIGR03083 family)